MLRAVLRDQLFNVIEKSLTVLDRPVVVSLVNRDYEFLFGAIKYLVDIDYVALHQVSVSFGDSELD